jgi:hypothetical protein
MESKPQPDISRRKADVVVTVQQALRRRGHRDRYGALLGAEVGRLVHELHIARASGQPRLSRSAQAGLSR